ncbi:16S rRNA pseudouridine(516) synthase RsuA [Spongiibacter sp. KMU-158]|uniref:Pseudouridine synthase n=1 Tax=Spongiibacter pelagi TaxID=2760804 RepID=A0A927C077_9GAMM|nr:16S rRNA pseudouridine(516) synthase RsuA [Spongiibacter pelagi]MBD2858840.1 16S rRNA pseudouridine(516) synthase RsuA [Spongiibacter pelagi]
MASSKPSADLRLDRFIATVTDFSRSEAKRLIKAGEIEVEGRVASDAGQLISPDAEVLLRGSPLRAPKPRYFMLHKPQGYICAARDRRHLTVLDLLDEDNPERLHVAGRLDIDTTGLVLLTDDGQWSHQITSPNRECWKQYWFQCAEPLDENVIRQFERGVFLKEEKTRTLPAKLEILSDFEGRLQICEGRYHQVKRMLGAVGNAVEVLHREAIGDIFLDADLAEGEYRPLTEDEIASV